MNTPHDFEWDIEKSETNRRVRGFGFEAATAVFLDPAVLTIDTTRAADGEARSKAVGAIEDKLFTVVFTLRGAVTRIISARRANTKEILAYDDR